MKLETEPPWTQDIEDNDTEENKNQIICKYKKLKPLESCNHD